MGDNTRGAATNVGTRVAWFAAGLVVLVASSGGAATRAAFGEYFTNIF